MEPNDKRRNVGEEGSLVFEVGGASVFEVGGVSAFDVILAILNTPLIYPINLGCLRDGKCFERISQRRPVGET
jgi:hypothetical protein